jgi:hypothetical protein
MLLEILSEEKNQESLNWVRIALLTFLRAAKDAEAKAAAKPIRVEITNASEFADKRGTVVRVERDGSGQLTGAVAQKI